MTILQALGIKPLPYKAADPAKDSLDILTHEQREDIKEAVRKAQQERANDPQLARLLECM